jgi:uncharacterized LabA/DUF88 family protein
MNVVYVFIDASNLWQAQKVKGKMFDYKKLKYFLKNKHQANQLLIFYYTAYPANGTRDYDLGGRHSFYTYLKKGLGFIVCISSELRTGTDKYIDVLKLKEDIWGRILYYKNKDNSP